MRNGKRNGWPLWLCRLIRLPVHDPAGAWVAECWLEWPTCRGSTMWRERFATVEHARRAAVSASRSLDFHLPRGEFGLKWGVRLALPADRPDPICTTYMPGHRLHRGEHWHAHPLRRVD